MSKVRAESPKPTAPPPAFGAEVDTFTITNTVVPTDGRFDIDLNSFANKNNANDVTITNVATDPITQIKVKNLGGNDGQQDVIRIDLPQFADNFAIILEKTGSTVEDFLFLEGVHRYTDNGDGTFSVSYYGSDSQLHLVQVTPQNATVDFYYAPDNIVDGDEGGDVIGPGDADFQGDSIDGADGDADKIVGYGGTDSISGGAGADTIFGDYDTFDGLLTPDLPPNAFTGTPPGPAVGAEVDSFALNNTVIDNNGQAKVMIETFANKSSPNDLSVFDGGTDDLNLLIIEKGGDGEADVFRLDVSGYNDDFDIELKNTDEFDTLILTNVHTIDENPDGTFTVTYYGLDGQLHTIDTIELHNASIEAYVTEDSPYFFGDTIDGGAGDDVIDGGFGDDSIDGGADDDLITGDVGLDTIHGGLGNDTIHGDFDAPLEPEPVPGTPDLTIDGSDIGFISGQFQPTIVTLMDSALANHILFVDGGTLNGLTEIKPRDFDDSNEPDILHFYLTTFDDDFNINIRSRGDANGDIYIEGAYQTEYDSGSGIWTITYYGSDEQLHTVTVDPGDAGVQTFFGPAPDSAFSDEHDLIFGEAGDDVLYGGFDDVLIGGAGADTIYGGDGEPAVLLERVAFEWSQIPDPEDGGAIDLGDQLTTSTQTVGGTTVTYTINNNNVTYMPGG